MCGGQYYNTYVYTHGKGDVNILKSSFNFYFGRARGSSSMRLGSINYVFDDEWRVMCAVHLFHRERRVNNNW